jgi:membrane protein DedA with SNARE-associated domain
MYATQKRVSSLTASLYIVGSTSFVDGVTRWRDADVVVRYEERRTRGALIRTNGEDTVQIPDWVNMALQTYGYWIVFAAIGIESMGIPFPGETTLLAGAAYAGVSGNLNIVAVILFAAAGAIIGDNIGYLIGRYGGYRLLGRIARYIRLNQSHLDAAQRYFARHGNKTVFFGRFMALLRAWAAFLAGVNQMPWRSFLLWNALGGVAWATIYGTLGFVLGANLPLLGRVAHMLGIAGIALTVAFVLAVIVYWRLRLKRLASSAAPSASVDQEPVGPLPPPGRNGRGLPR